MVEVSTQGSRTATASLHYSRRSRFDAKGRDPAQEWVSDIAACKRSRGLSSRPGGHDGREGWAATAPPAERPMPPRKQGARRNGGLSRARAPARVRCAATPRGAASSAADAEPRGGPSGRRDPQLQQPVAQPRHLAAGTRSTRRPQSQFLHEHVGRGGQEDAQLVRREQTAARAVDLQTIEQFLDPILDVPRAQ